MQKPIGWVGRRFDFHFDAMLYPSLIERLRGAPARMDERLESLPAAMRTRRPQPGKWSLQEHAGHLLALESLFSGRLDDFEAGREALRAADMTNRATEEADYNAVEAGRLASDFRTARMELAGRLEALPPSAFMRTALHPRLETPMRLADMLYFQAEHDDHHFAMMRWLEGRIRG